MKIRATLTYVWEYDANPEDYGTDDPGKMVGIDKDNWEDDPSYFLDSAPKPTVTVEVVG